MWCDYHVTRPPFSLECQHYSNEKPQITDESNTTQMKCLPTLHFTKNGFSHSCLIVIVRCIKCKTVPGLHRRRRCGVCPGEGLWGQLRLALSRPLRGRREEGQQARRERWDINKVLDSISAATLHNSGSTFPSYHWIRTFTTVPKRTIVLCPQECNRRRLERREVRGHPIAVGRRPPWVPRAVAHLPQPHGGEAGLQAEGGDRGRVPVHHCHIVARTGLQVRWLEYYGSYEFLIKLLSRFYIRNELSCIYSVQQSQTQIHRHR